MVDPISLYATDPHHSPPDEWYSKCHPTLELGRTVDSEFELSSSTFLVASECVSALLLLLILPPLSSVPIGDDEVLVIGVPRFGFGFRPMHTVISFKPKLFLIPTLP